MKRVGTRILIMVMSIALSGCLSIDIRKYVDEGIALAQDRTLAHLEQPEVRAAIVDRTVERVAEQARIQANQYYDKMLDDLRQPGVSLLDVLGLLVLGAGKLVLGV
ncbi:MAG: hypothetical protein GXP25_12790 [Planctomycetes bacterium]|nr:hypothetical protein [Planctomycetota bacterium]